MVRGRGESLVGDNQEGCTVLYCNVLYCSPLYCTLSLQMIHVTGGSVKGPDKLLVRKCSERRPGKSSTGDHFVSHHLQTVEDGDGVGGELHPPVLLIPHVRGCGTFLPQDPELSQWEPVHQTAARHV